MVVGVDDVRCAVRGVDRDLEEVEERPISGRVAQLATEAVDADRPAVDNVVARLEHAPGRPAVDGLRHIRVPLVVDVVLRAGLRAGSPTRAVEDDVGDAGRPSLGPRHDRGVHAGWIGDQDRRDRGVPSGAGGVGLDHDVIAVGPDRVDLAAGVDGRDREDPVVPRADRTVIDLVIPPADDRCAGCRNVGHRPDGLVDAVEVAGRREPLIDVVLLAVWGHEDGVEGQRTTGWPAGHDVAQPVPGRARRRIERALPLRLGHVERVDDRAALDVGLPAISRRTELDVDDGDVVIGHVDVGESEVV